MMNLVGRLTLCEVSFLMPWPERRSPKKRQGMKHWRYRNVGRRAYLKDARARADEGKSVETTVRELLSLWGARVRSHRISQRIDADLANHGLATSPSFRKVTLDATVVLVGESEELQEKPPVESPDADGGDELDIGLRARI